MAPKETTELTETAGHVPAAEVFALDTCPGCLRLLKQLRLAKADFAFVDIEVRPGAAEWVAKVNGGAYTVPTVRYRDGSVQVKPSFEEVLARIDQLNSTSMTEQPSNLTIYFADWCPFCRRLIEGLTEQDVQFDLVDVETDDAASEWVKSVNDGDRVVPTLRFWDDTTMTNPPVKKVLRKLGERENS